MSERVDRVLMLRGHAATMHVNIAFPARDPAARMAPRLKARPMKPTNLHSTRSAYSAAWSMALGFGGVAAQRVAGIGPAPI